MAPFNQQLITSISAILIAGLAIVVLLANKDSHALVPSISSSSSSSSNGQSSSQSCHHRELELCATSGLTFLQNPNGLPMTDAQVDKQCEYLAEAQECTERYVERCMQNTRAQLVQLLMGEAMKVRDEFCTAGTELRMEYMKYAPCMNKVQRKYQRQCIFDLQVGLERIHKIPLMQRLPTGCCNMRRLYDCIVNNLSNECGADSVKFVNSVIDRVLSRAPRVLCNNYQPDSEKCRDLLPAPGTKPYNGRNTSSISRLLSTYSNMNFNNN